MNVWLVNISEPTPFDGENIRLMRTALIASEIVKSNNKVIIWKSSFDHVHKRQRFKCDTSINNDRINYEFLFSPSYNSNTGFQRLFNHYVFSIKLFNRFRKCKTKPDLIVTSYPCIFQSYVVVCYAKKNKIPVIVDIRDFWPDIFAEALLKKIKIFNKILLYPFDIFANYALKNATALTSMIPFGLKWGQIKGKRINKFLDRVFYLSYRRSNLTDQEKEDCFGFWKKYNIENKKVFTICYIGNLGAKKSVSDIETTINAVKNIINVGYNIKYVICGRGESLSYYSQQCKSYPTIIFPGYINSMQIKILLSYCSFGLIPYKNRFDFKHTIPNKAAEYLSEGIPIITCLKGHINKALKPYNCILNYKEGDPESLGGLLKRLINGQHQFNHMKDGALIAYENHFNAEKEYPRMVKYFEDIVDTYRSENFMKG
jgi:glycosyltransferase involved in cell wall biosynthesis